MLIRILCTDVGAYYQYRHWDGEGQYCGDGYNQRWVSSLSACSFVSTVTCRGSLPEDIERATCNEGIKLENVLYKIFWENGAWYVSNCFSWLRSHTIALSI